MSNEPAGTAPGPGPQPRRAPSVDDAQELARAHWEGGECDGCHISYVLALLADRERLQRRYDDLYAAYEAKIQEFAAETRRTSELAAERDAAYEQGKEVGRINGSVRLEALRAERDALHRRLNECADDFAALPSSNWTGQMVADTLRAVAALSAVPPVPAAASVSPQPETREFANQHPNADTLQSSDQRNRSSMTLTNTPGPGPVTATPPPTVEIGGQVMTQAQYDAARYPLLADDPGPTVPESDDPDLSPDAARTAATPKEAPRIPRSMVRTRLPGVLQPGATPKEAGE